MTLSDRVTIRWKLFGGIGIIGSVLLLVMGYNLASLTEDNRLEEIDFQSRRDTGLMQKRYKSCEAQRKSMAESKGGKVDTIDFLNLDIKGSEEQIATAQRMIQLTSTLHTECEDKRSELTNQLETRTTTLDELQESITALKLSLKAPQMKHAQQVKILKGYVRILRLENDALQKRIDAKVELTKRNNEERRKQEALQRKQALSDEEAAKEREEELEKERESKHTKYNLDNNEIDRLVGDGDAPARKKTANKIEEYDGDTDAANDGKKERMEEKEETVKEKKEETAKEEKKEDKEDKQEKKEETDMAKKEEKEDKQEDAKDEKKEEASPKEEKAEEDKKGEDKKEDEPAADKKEEKKDEA